MLSRIVIAETTNFSAELSAFILFFPLFIFGLLEGTLNNKASVLPA
jgi:hypothetical protein